MEIQIRWKRTLKIQIKYNGESSYTDLITDTVTGRTGDAYQKDYLVNLDHTKNSGNAFPLDIKVVRTTADSGDESLKDSFTWTSFTTVIDEKQR